LIRTISLDGFPEGENTIEWNGLTGQGEFADTGTYSYEILAYDILDNSIETETMFSGVVDGITFKDGAAHLKVGSVLIPFENVIGISEND